MLCEAKHNAIVQWFNSLTSPSNNISSLSQLKDGSILQNHINEGTQESQERAVTSNDKKYNFFKEEDSRAIFEIVKKHINETLRVSSEELIDYEGCLRGSEVELAKVAAFVLCITVTLLLEKPLGNPRLSLLSQLDDAIQVEIRECMDCIMVYPSSDLRRADLVRVLGRSTLIKEKLIRVSNSPAKLMATPRKRGRPKKFADFETSLCSTPPNSDEGPKILLQMMDSPKVKIWSNMAVKEREILILRRELELADNKIIDQRVMIEQLRNDLDKRGEEFQQLKEKVRELQEEADARDQSMDARSEALEATVSSANQSRAKLMATISAYEIEIASLKTEVDIHKNNSEDLISKLERYREKDAVARGQLAESQSQLQSVRAEKESLEGEAERLRFELSEMKGMISVYKDKLQEREKEYESKLLECSTPEIVGDFFEEDYRATREKLLEEELENAKLRRLLEEKTALCEEQRALLENRATAPAGPRSGNSDDGEERKWTDYREELPNRGSGHESPEPDLRDDKEGVALNELVLLAERAFSAHAEGPMPELPGGGLDRVKSLLQELLVPRSSPPAVKGEPFETKSDEVSLDSGVPASDPGSNEEEPPRPELPNPFASRERLFGENESLQYLQKALRLKEEFEKKNNDLLESVGELTAKVGEASQKLEECQRGLSESEAQKKLVLKKYSKLKEYTLKVEGKLEDLKLCKSELKSRQEELMEYRARVKELQASIALYRDSRDKFETRADLIEERNEELEKMNTNLQLELETEKCKCKELASRLEELKLRQEWSYQSDYRDQGRPPKREKLCVEVER
ncbi:centrosomal protein of 83 kDa-like, partial [Uloborus diversus]|uniref:centrosomal protein of 83 kDa-like n=1 Tax=Uloborus diversus TaxID=327109 RepID=UPI002409D51B